MKRGMWAVFITPVVLILVLGAVVVVAAGSPFSPADGWFYSSQRSLEEAVGRLRSRPMDQASLRIDLARRRLKDVLESGAGPARNQAVLELEQALRTAVEAASRCPQADASQLRLELLGLFEDVARALPAGSSAQDGFPAWMSVITRLLRLPGLQLADLGGVSPGGLSNDVSLSLPSQASPPLPVPTPTEAAVPPHIILFPPGSAGAKHAFYPLVGKHLQIECTACHPQGEYAGTGRTCETCHLQQKPVSHYPGACDLCHAPTAWADIHYVHSAPLSDNCALCHQRDKPAGHYNGQCSACHSTAAWLPAHFNHSAAGAINCISCHSSDRPAKHWDAQCSACHSTDAWLPAHFNHDAAGAVDCVSCHSQNRPANHWGGQCSACHSTSAWLPASFNHAAARATDCIACHSANRPANHFGGQCSACHSTRGWLPASFNHSFPINHGGANGQCAACHPGGTGSWTCFGCHDQARMDAKHLEEGITDYASRCLSCHPGGRGGD